MQILRQRRVAVLAALCLFVSGCSPIAPIGARPDGSGQSATAAPPVTSEAAPASPAPPGQQPTQAATTAAPSATTPAVDEFANAVLDTSGLGPIKLGTAVAELRRRGWVELEPNCQQWISSKQLASQGVQFVNYVYAVNSGSPSGPRTTGNSQTRVDPYLGEIWLRSDHYTTKSGAKVGMTYGQIQQIYGGGLRLDHKATDGSPSVPVAIVRGGDREVVFVTDWDEAGPTKNDQITAIVTRFYSTDMHGGC